MIQVLNFYLGTYRFSIYRYDDNLQEIFLANVFVKKRYRHKGLGNKIIKQAVNEAKKLKGKVLILNCKKYSWVHGWYKRKGFKDITPLNANMIWMSKTLSNK